MLVAVEGMDGLGAHSCGAVLHVDTILEHAAETESAYIGSCPVCRGTVQVAKRSSSSSSSRKGGKRGST